MRFLKKNVACKEQYYDEVVPFRRFISEILVCRNFEAKNQNLLGGTKFLSTLKVLLNAFEIDSNVRGNLTWTFLFPSVVSSNRSNRLCWEFRLLPILLHTFLSLGHWKRRQERKHLRRLCDMSAFQGCKFDFLTLDSQAKYFFQKLSLKALLWYIWRLWAMSSLSLKWSVLSYRPANFSAC